MQAAFIKHEVDQVEACANRIQQVLTELATALEISFM